jgi:hypothetical protein
MRVKNNNLKGGYVMSLMIKMFWISLASLILMAIIALGVIGIPAKPVTVVKSIPNDQLTS